MSSNKKEETNATNLSKRIFSKYTNKINHKIFSFSYLNSISKGL